MDEATKKTLYKIKRRLCKKCREDSKPTCPIYRMHEFFKAMEYVMDGATITEAIEKAEKSAKNSLATLNIKHDKKLGGKG